MHKRGIDSITLLLVLFTMVSCQKDTFYHSYQPVDSTGWEKNDTLLFQLPTALHARSYDYEIGIRHKDSYKYRDIWLTINQDTLHLYLADSIGNWKGSGIGEMRQMTQELSLPLPDSIREFRITHIMQDNPITGIHDIGIQVKRRP